MALNINQALAKIDKLKSKLSTGEGWIVSYNTLLDLPDGTTFSYTPAMKAALETKISAGCDSMIADLTAIKTLIT